MDIHEIADYFDDSRPSGTGYKARCPMGQNHNNGDRNPSLSIWTDKDGNVAVCCQSQRCNQDDILAEVGLDWRDLKADGFAINTTLNTTPMNSEGKRMAKRKFYNPAKHVATYRYTDADGRYLCEKRRDSEKEFAWFHCDNSGNGGHNVPYRLHNIANSDQGDLIYLCEGEKDADRLAKKGYETATCLPTTGAWRDEYAEYFQDRDVVLFMDNDKAGDNATEKLGRVMLPITQTLRRVSFAHCEAEPTGYDVSDFLDQHTLDEFEALVNAAPLVKNTNTPKADTGTSRPILTRMSDVDPCDVRWLWPGHIPSGRITTLGGRPGLGKSFVTIDWAARISTGTPWPDGSPCERGSVIFITAEDDPADTVRPRLDAHHADVSRIHVLTGVMRAVAKGEPAECMFTLQDVEALEQALTAIDDVNMVVVDPIGSFVGGRVDANQDNQLRGVLAPVNKLAERFGCAVIIVAHHRKSPGVIADDMILGSRGLTGISRAVWHVTADGDNKSRRLFLPGKNNLSAQQQGWAFSIAGEPASVNWESEPLDMHADDVMVAEGNGESAPALGEACSWLKQHLSDGPRTGRDVKESARRDGIATRTLERASEKLKVVAGPSGFQGPWVWKLPESANTSPESPESAKENDWRNVESLDVSGGLCGGSAPSEPLSDAERAGLGSNWKSGNPEDRTKNPGESSCVLQAKKPLFNESIEDRNSTLPGENLRPSDTGSDNQPRS